MNISNNITPIPQIYRRGSTYQTIFEILYRHSMDSGGVSREKLLEEVKQATGKDEKRLLWAISITTASASLEDGAHFHKSCKAEYYYVQKEGSFLKLVMREPANV